MTYFLVWKWFGAISNSYMFKLISRVKIVRFFIIILLNKLLFTFLFLLLVMSINTSNEKSISIIFDIFHFCLLISFLWTIHIILSSPTFMFSSVFSIVCIRCWWTFLLLVEDCEIVDIYLKFLVIRLMLCLTLCRSVIHICFVFQN